MNTILSLWKPTTVFGKIVWQVLRAVGIIAFIGLIGLLFCKSYSEVDLVFKIAWIACAVLNIDVVAEYRKTKQDKVLRPFVTVYVVLTCVYLYVYWEVLSIPLVVTICIEVAMLEFIITVASTKTVRLTEKQKLVELPSAVIQWIVLGGLYVCAILLFVAGLLSSQTVLFIGGVGAVILLTISVLFTISNGISLKKNAANIAGFTVDIITLLALVVYLIYLTPQENNLQTIVLTIVASVIGGALALAGVAWTIKHGEKERQEERNRLDVERQEEERKKYKPLIFCVAPDHFIDRKSFTVYFDDPVTSDNISIVDENSGDYIIDVLRIHNADFSFSSLKGICINDDVIGLEIAQTFKKDQSYEVVCQFGFVYKKEIREISLLLVDLLDNYYALTTNFGIEDNTIFINSGIELVPVTVDFENLTITKEVK